MKHMQSGLSTVNNNARVKATNRSSYDYFKRARGSCKLLLDFNSNIVSRRGIFSPISASPANSVQSLGK